MQSQSVISRTSKGPVQMASINHCNVTAKYIAVTVTVEL
jgi:hypothetical protein